MSRTHFCAKPYCNYHLQCAILRGNWFCVTIPCVTSNIASRVCFINDFECCIRRKRSSLTVIPRRVTVGIPQTEIEISKIRFYDKPVSNNVAYL